MEPLALAVAQTVSSQGKPRENALRHRELASRAADEGARLVLFPELSLQGYGHGWTREHVVGPEDPMLAPLRELAAARDVVLVVGTPLAAPDGVHIGALSLLPDGRVEPYTKVHVHSTEKPMYVDGEGGAQLPLGGEQVGLAICADMTHPEHARACVAGGATVYAAGCFFTPQCYDKDTALLEGYARELDVLVLMANFGGPCDGMPAAGRSAVWAPGGEPLAVAAPEGEDVLVVERTRNGWKARARTRA